MQNYRLGDVAGIRDILHAALSTSPRVLFQLRFIAVFRMIFFSADWAAG